MYTEWVAVLYAVDTDTSRRRVFVDPIQNGHEFCKRLLKLQYSITLYETSSLVKKLFYLFAKGVQCLIPFKPFYIHAKAKNKITS